MKRMLSIMLAIISVLVLAQMIGVNPALAAGPADSKYSQLNRELEQLSTRMPDGYFYPWAEFSVLERIRICRLALRIVDCREKILIYEEENSLPRTSTWSSIANTRSSVGYLLEQLLVERRLDTRVLGAADTY